MSLLCTDCCWLGSDICQRCLDHDKHKERPSSQRKRSKIELPPSDALSASGALNYDQGKVRLELLPFEALEEIARGFTYGAQKYDDDNWTKGMRWRRHIGSLLRHIFAFAQGEDIDTESGLSHLALAGCRILMLLQCTLLKIGQDDRPNIHD